MSALNEPLTLYTIGHSHHEPEDFAALLRQYRISLLVDIRTTERAVRVLHILRDGGIETVHSAEFGTQRRLGL